GAVPNLLRSTTYVRKVAALAFWLNKSVFLHEAPNTANVSTLPIPHNEKERLRALRNYEILDSLREYDFDRIAELASLICDVPISLITLMDEDRQWYKSAIGFDVAEIPREISFCNHTITDAAFFEITDASADE